MSRLALNASHERISLGAWLALAAAVAWIVLMLGSAQVEGAELCMTALVWLLPSAETFLYVLSTASPSRLALEWAAMVVAMMLPTLSGQLHHLRERSLRRLRTFSSLLFLASYMAVWLAAGALLLSFAIVLRLAASGTFLPLGLASSVAVIWQVSPLKQVALNRCHQRPAVAAFPPGAYQDAMRFGVFSGFWCLASCWGMMLATLLVPAHHVAAMAAVAIFVWVERLEPARMPRWQLRLPMKGLSLVAWRCRQKRRRGLRPPVSLVSAPTPCSRSLGSRLTEALGGPSTDRVPRSPDWFF